MKTEPVTIRLPVGLGDRVRKKAREEKRNISDVVAEALEFFLATGREGFYRNSREARDYAYLAAYTLVYNRAKEQGKDPKQFLDDLAEAVLGRKAGEW